MFKKYLVLGLSVLVINLSLSPLAFGETKEEKAVKLAEKVKANIIRLGTGKDARVEVKLRDKTKLNGYVSQIGENSFVVVDEKTGTASDVPYPNVKQVKGNNLSTGVKIVIGVAIAFAILLLVSYVLVRCCDD